MIDINQINAKDHEFTGDEMGELLLESVRQMKRGETSKTHHLAVSQAIAEKLDRLATI